MARAPIHEAERRLDGTQAAGQRRGSADAGRTWVREADGFTDRCHTDPDLPLCARLPNFAPYSPDDRALTEVWVAILPCSPRTLVLDAEPFGLAEGRGTGFPDREVA